MIKKIYISDISPAHPNLGKGYATDYYYTQLANKLQNDLFNSGVSLEDCSPNIIRYATITLTCYMEDIVADSGQWRMFSNLSQEMFGWPVPMYHDKSEEYYPDEPSLMAVRYLIWHAANEMEDIWWNADSDILDTLATVAYQRLSDEFENAPINEQLTEDIEFFMKESEEDFNKMRFALIWLITNCYLLRTANSEEFLIDKMENTESLKDMMPDERMRRFYTYMTCIFAYKFGPLALYPKQYLAALARTKFMENMAKALDEIEVIPIHAFRYTASVDCQTLHMECTNGRTIDVEREEFTLEDDKLFSTNGCFASFVYYQDKWRLNGVMSAMKNIEDQWEDLCKKDPDYIPEGQAVADADWYIRHTGGKQLLFFKDAMELKKYMVEKMKFNMDMLSPYGKEKEQNQPTMVFIDKDEPKDCLHISYGFCPSIKAPENPYYDRQTAIEEAMEMLWNDQSVSTGTVLYLLEKGYVPDILNDKLISQKGTLQTRISDARFLLRYMRQHKY